MMGDLDPGRAAVDNRADPLLLIVGESFVTQGCRLLREARRGCCVMLEAQLAESGCSLIWMQESELGKRCF